MQKEEYLIKNACYSVTKYYLCKQNNKRSLLGRKQRSQVARSFPNRYQFSCTNKVTSLFSISCILRIILPCQHAAITPPLCRNRNTPKPPRQRRRAATRPPRGCGQRASTATGRQLYIIKVGYFRFCSTRSAMVCGSMEARQA